MACHSMVRQSTAIHVCKKQTFLLFRIQILLKYCRGWIANLPKRVSSATCAILTVLFLKATLVKFCAATSMLLAQWDTNSSSLPTLNTFTSSHQCADKHQCLLTKVGFSISPPPTLHRHYANKQFAHWRQWEFPWSIHSTKMHQVSKK